MSTRTPSRVQSRAALTTIPLGTLMPASLTLSAIVLWGISLQGVNLSRMDDLGLMSVLPPTFYAAFVLLTISFALVVHRRQTQEPLLLLNLAVLISIIHGTPELLYGTVRYAWTWKHIGITEYIQHFGSVDPNIDAYHNWPGFFAVSALFTEVAGLHDAIGFAGWGPVFFNLLFAGGLLMIFKTFTVDRRLIWLGVWWFALTNWIGQDYFSPQAFGYFLYLVVLGICLAWFRVTTPPTETAIKRWLRVDWLSALLHSLFTRAANSLPPSPPSHPYQRVGLIMIVVPILGVIAFSHQLTPFMLISALAALVIFQVIRTRNFPVLLSVITATWILYLAETFLRGNLFWVIDSIGRLFVHESNPDLIDYSIASPDQVFVSFVGRVFAGLVIVLALFGAIRRLRAGYWDLAAMLLAITPVLMLVANSYGGEMLFRSYFFALPFFAFFAGALAYPSQSAGSSWRTAAMTMLLSCTLLVGMLFAYYGKERMYYFTQKEVDAAEYMYYGAPKGSILVSATWDYPSLFHNYESFNYMSICCGPNKVLPSGQESIVEALTRLMRQYPAGYLIFTRSQRAHMEMSGLISPAQLQSIERSIRQSKEFKLIYTNEDADIFAVVNSGVGVGK